MIPVKYARLAARVEEAENRIRPWRVVHAPVGYEDVVEAAYPNERLVVIRVFSECRS